ncbi:MAG: Trk family potassium uptake protein [Clostridia bacterium]|nr:Trk family potassium uptake protein [Clostridia bacterium]
MNKKRKFTSAQIIILGFLMVVLTGTFFLCLPFSSADGKFTGFTDALFTATSATCVTGLVVKTTSEYWSTFGQTVILILIQIGGLGFMTFVTLFVFFIKGHVGLFDKKTFMQSAGIANLGSVFRLFRRILIGTLVVEFIGAALLCVSFVPEYGLGKGIFFAVFHSVSAFCNAGFDIIGAESLSAFSGDPLVILTVSFLIIIGGLGFVVWSNVLDCKFRFRRFNLHTKIVLFATLALITVPTALFLTFDWNASLKDMNFGEKLLGAFFQVISPRTAGFYSLNLSEISDSSYVLTTILMFIGGNSGSTAGGIKTTTLIVILFSIYAEVRRSDRIIIGKRRLPPGDAKTASAILALYTIIIFLSTLIICAVEPLIGLKEIFYEVVSAICTVGLSLGITSGLTVASQLIITLLMFIGRVGSVSVALAFGERKDHPPVELPTEKIMIG